MEGVGKIVQGVNTTVDVKPGQTEKEAKKFFGGNGKPKPLGGSHGHKAFNLGLTESLDVPTPSVEYIAKMHNVSVEQIEQQLALGVEVELEHTTDVAIAQEIALDHLAELPDYYDRLASVEEDVAGPIKAIKNFANFVRHGNKPMKIALEMMHKIITKKGTDAHHGVNWYADKVARQFPEGVIDVRALIDAYEEQYGVTERKLSGGEKRSKEAHFKKLKKHKGDFEKRYGKDAESVMHAVATKRAKGE